MNSLSRLVRCGGAIALAAVAASCTEPKPKPVAIMSATPTSITAAAGLSVAVPPAVRVTDAKGGGVGGVAVTFAVTAGGGTLTSATVTSADDGSASSGGWKLGTTAGTNTVTASVAGLTGSPVIFTATGTAGPPASLALNAGGAQTATVNTPVIVSPSVRVLDANSNPVPNVAVTFAVTSGGGTISATTATTSALGIATLGTWTMGPSAGPNTLMASVVGVASTVTFTATATASLAPLAVAMNAGDKQATMVSNPVATPPSVLVTSDGVPTPGVTVTFSVASGGGSVTGGIATTNANGIATVGSWTLGSGMGLNSLNAAVAGSNVTGSPVSFIASGCDGVGAGYRITLCFTADMTAAQKTAFTTAAARWESIVAADLLDVSLSGLTTSNCGGRAFSMPSGTLVDDVLIFATIEAIDGQFGVLGSAGPCFIRQSNSLPVVGSMRFDVADIGSLSASNLNSVILHEMGHVMGIGSLWNFPPTFTFLQLASSAISTLDTHFNGANGIAGFNAIGGNTYTGGNKVPVANVGGTGSINSHWRENVLQNELMTPNLNSSTANPLSVLSIGSLQDMGYSVNLGAADPFSLTLNLMAQGSGPVTGTIHMLNDVDFGPLYSIDSRGVIKRVR